MQDTSILNINDLNLFFESSEVRLHGLRDINLHLKKGESLGIVGESGSGKSLLSLAIMGLLPPQARIQCKSLKFNGIDLTKLNSKKWQELRGQKISMIFQDPMRALNPTSKIQKQFNLLFEAHGHNLSASEAKLRAQELLIQVGMPQPELKLQSYCHELSGGQAQRIMIAMAMAGNPDLLIADEPTTALDVTIQSQVLSLIRSLQAASKMSLVFISHDIALLSQNVQYIAVMYAGEIVEYGSTSSITTSPKHPYTRALLECLPSNQAEGAQLKSISGNVPHLSNRPPGCQFSPRCSLATSKCYTEIPPFIHHSKCFLSGDQNGNT